MTKEARHPHRRMVLAGGIGLAGGALAAPAIHAQPSGIEWRMVTSWPSGLPGPGTSAQRVARTIETLSAGRLRVRIFAAGELVPGLEVFDAVAGGTAEMAHTASFFWQGKAPASVFFTAIPFGLTPIEHLTWIEEGGGQALWDQLYAPFGIKPFLAGNTGFQMGGWFTRPVRSLDDLQGLKMRMPGLGGEVVRRLGATPVALPPSEIFPALQSGVIDATEFLGPWSDRAMGFHRVARHYHWPGFHEPNGTGEALVSQAALSALPQDLAQIVAIACREAHVAGLAQAEWNNAAALRALVEEDDVVLSRFPEDVLDAARATSAEVLAEFADTDAMTSAIHASFRAARDRLGPWLRVSQAPFLAARDA